MNYKKRYDRLIETRKARELTNSLQGYKEKHHIVPKCMDGLDTEENLVELTPEEHFTAHLLLMMIYPENLNLARAVRMMTVGKRRSNRLCGVAKRRSNAANRGENSPCYGKKWANKSGESKLILPDKSLSEGWSWGTGRTGWVWSKDRISITDHKTTKKHDKDKPIPEGWVRGIHSTGTRRPINNGKITKFHPKNEPLPEGWNWGRISRGCDKVIWIYKGPVSKHHNKNESIPRGWAVGRGSKSPLKDQIWIHNELVDKLINKDDPIPEGWSKGKLADDLRDEPEPIVIIKRNSSASTRLKRLQSAEITDFIWSEMIREYLRLRLMWRREPALKATYEFLIDKCKITRYQVDCFTRLPLLDMTLREYIDEYCTQC